MDVEEERRDPRFNKWTASLSDRSTKMKRNTKSCWPDMWPATVAERDQLAIKDERFKKCVSLEEIKETIGVANYLLNTWLSLGEVTKSSSRI